MDSSSSEDLIHSAALAELANGPMELNDLTDRLRRAGALDDLEGLDDERAELELDDALLGHADVWVVDDGLVASIPSLLDGVHFSHSVSASELERGVLHVHPDLVLLDLCVDGSLTLAGGGELEPLFDGEPEWDARAYFTGPPGWLDLVAPGT